MRIFPVFVCVFVLSVFSPHAYADIQSYCELFAKDFADGKTPDIDSWEVNFRNGFTDCTTQYTADAAVTAPQKKVAKKAVQKVVVVPVKDFSRKKRTPILEPGSIAWNKYCAAKYLSFNKVTGNYRSKSGKEFRCRVPSD